MGSHAGDADLRSKSRMDAQQVAGGAGNGGDGGCGWRSWEQRARDFRASGGKQGRAGAAKQAWAPAQADEDGGSGDYVGGGREVREASWMKRARLRRLERVSPMRVALAELFKPK